MFTAYFYSLSKFKKISELNQDHSNQSKNICQKDLKFDFEICNSISQQLNPMRTTSKITVAAEVTSKGIKVSKRNLQLNQEASKFDKAKFSNVSLIVKQSSDIEAQAVEDSFALALQKSKKGSMQSSKDFNPQTEKKSCVQEPAQDAPDANFNIDEIEESKSSKAQDSKERVIQQPVYIGSRSKAEEDKSDWARSPGHGKRRQIYEITHDLNHKDDVELEPSCKIKKVNPNSQFESQEQSMAKSQASKEESKSQQVLKQASPKKEASPTKLKSSAPETFQPVRFSKKVHHLKNIVVPLKKEYAKAMPLGCIQSRNSTAMILSYYGDSYDVCTLMQKGSHRTRAFIANADLLKGFLVPYCPVRVVERASEQDREAMCEYLVIHFKRVIRKLRELKTSEARIKFLQQYYPSVAHYVMIQMGMEKALNEYSNRCCSYENDERMYKWYAHGYLIPFIESLRKKGEIKQGKQYFVLIQKYILGTLTTEKSVVYYRGDLSIQFQFIMRRYLCEYSACLRPWTWHHCWSTSSTSSAGTSLLQKTLPKVPSASSWPMIVSSWEKCVQMPG